MNDKAMKSFGLRLKGEAVRHNKVTPRFLLWAQHQAKAPAKHAAPLTCSGKSANARRTQTTQIIPRDVGPAHSLSCSESLREHRVHCYQKVLSATFIPRSAISPALPQGRTAWTVPAASVTDQLQHLLRIHYLLPGFASSFSSCHFGSIYLLPL